MTPNQKKLKKGLRCRKANSGMNYVKQVPKWVNTSQEINLQINLTLQSYELPKDVTIEDLATALARHLKDDSSHHYNTAIAALIGLMPDLNYFAERIIQQKMVERYPTKIQRSLFKQEPSGGGWTSSMDYNHRIAEMRVKNSPVVSRISLQNVIVTPTNETNES